MFKRRIGLDPHRDGAGTAGASGCPDIWELDDGNFAVIGREETSLLQPHLPPTAGCGPDERIVVIPRSLLIHARDFVPDS
jgi:hypothetical protein